MEPEQVHNPVAYGILLFAQTAAACMLFWMAFPIFYQLVTHLGERQDLAVSDQIVIVFSAPYYTDATGRDCFGCG